MSRSSQSRYAHMMSYRYRRHTRTHTVMSNEALARVSMNRVWLRSLLDYDSIIFSWRSCCESVWAVLQVLIYSFHAFVTPMNASCRILHFLENVCSNGCQIARSLLGEEETPNTRNFICDRGHNPQLIVLFDFHL